MASRKRPYEITDQKALFEAHGDALFKIVPDHSKIRKVLSTGLKLPGVELISTPIEKIIEEKSND